MASPWTAALIALFAWWFFTGAILLLIRRADGADPVAHGRTVFMCIPLSALGVAGLVISSTELTTLNVYIGFVSILLIWGWIELAFLAGVITGPERRPCPPTLRGMARFNRAWHTVSYHEFLLLFAFMLITVITTQAPNTIGFWAYLVLFAARISAKLNFFFGVPRINVEFVPRPLSYLQSYFRQGPITLAFPVGVTLLSIASAIFAERLFAATTGPMITGYALLTALAVLATIEHWLMVLPLPDAKLWRWMLPAPPKTLKDQTHEL